MVTQPSSHGIEVKILDGGADALIATKIPIVARPFLPKPKRRLPTSLLNRAYDIVAAIRHRLFRRPREACPILPPDLRDRFGS